MTLSTYRVEFTWASDASFTVYASDEEAAIELAKRRFEEEGFNAVEDEHLHFTDFSAECVGGSL